MRRQAWRAALLLLFAGAPLVAAQESLSPARSAWTFRADFDHGLTGWMSFPLAQDIGFDPSLFTEQQDGQTILVRQVEVLGQKRVLLGVIRPIDFTAGPQARFRFTYMLRISGQLASMQIILAGANGHRYSASLPRTPGTHAVEISGSQLGLPPAGIAVQAVVLLGRIEGPPPSAQEQLTIRHFELRAERRPEAAISFPVLHRSEVGPDVVSGQVIGPGASLQVRVEDQQSGARADLDDPMGQLVKSVPVPSNRPVSISLGLNPAPGLWTANITSGPAQTAFHFLVLEAVPPHPRILLREKRLAQLRQMPQYARLREQIHRQAQSMAAAIAYNPDAGNNIAQLPGGTGLHAGFVGELKAYFKLLESYANAISYNALDYSLNGNTTSLEAARRGLVTVAKWKTWTPPRFTSHGLHTYYEVGVFSQRVAFGYDLIAPRLSTDEKREIADAFWRQIIAPTVDEYFLYDRMPLAASNWMANSLGGAVAAAVAVEGDTPEWPTREGVALAELLAAYDRLQKGLFPGDGSEAEPAGYENFAMEGLSWSAAALDGLGIRPRGTARMWEGFWWPYYAMVNPSLVLDTGDFDGRLEKLPGFAMGAQRAGIPALRDFYDRSNSYLELSAQPDIGHTGRALEQASGPLDLTCCSEPPANYPQPPPSRIFPLRGSAVLRSGWSKDATVISLRAGPWFNHEHHDEGSFQVAAFGQKLISEAGYSSYYDDPNYPIYFTQASGHNTVLLDGDPFSQTAYNGDFWAAFADHPQISGHLLSPSFDYLSADLKLAYGGELSSYDRDFVFIKPDVLVVRDRISSPRAHVYTWLLHSPAAAEVSATGERATIEMPGVSASMVTEGAAGQWKIKAAPISIIKFDDVDHGVIHTPREFYLESARARAGSFLVGMRFARGAPRESKTAIHALKTAAGEGIVAEGDTSLGVLFKTRPGSLELKTFSTDGDVLAVRGVGEQASLLAVGARTIEESGKTAFRSKTPVSVAWERKQAAIDLSIDATSETEIEIAAAKPPSEVRVDGAAAHFEFRAGMTILQGIAKGAHRVEIGY